MSPPSLDALPDHLLGVVRLLVIAGGPIPLCLAVVADAAPRSTPRRVLIMLTLWCAIQADIALLAGLLHRFEVATVVTAELLVLAVGSVALVRRRARCREILHDAGRGVRGTKAAARVVVLALVLIGASELWHVAAIPVVDWDSWAFHMPTMARWLQNGQFLRLDQYVVRPRTYYPSTWEAVSTLFMMPFHEDAFVTLPSLVAWALLGVATFVAARSLSADRLHALVAAAFVISMPHLLGQVNSLHIDVPLAAFVIAGVSFAIAFNQRRLPSDLALFVAVLGLMCGVRTTGPPYAAALTAFLLGLRRWAPGSVAAQRASAADRRLMMFCCATFLLVGTFWWIKNFAEHGRPFGPIAMLPKDVTSRTFDKDLPKIASSAFLFAFDPFAVASWKHVAERAWNEVGLPLPIMLLQLALWPAALRANRPPRERRGAIVAGLVALGAIILFVITPTGGISGIQLRLGFPALAAIAIAGAVGASAAGVPAALSALLAVVAIADVSAHSRVFQVAAVALMPLALLRRWRPRQFATPALVALLGLTLVVMTFAARQWRLKKRVDMYGPAFAYLEEHVGDDEPVAYLFSNQSYYYYGARLRRTVRYAPLPREGPTPAWFEQLRAGGIRAVIIGPDEHAPDRQAYIDRLRAPQGELVPVFGGGQPGGTTVYRFADR